MPDNENGEYNVVIALNDEVDLRTVLDLTLFKYAPIFINVVDKVYFAVPQFIFVSEDMAKEYGEGFEEYSKGFNNLAVYSGMIMDLNTVVLRSAIATDEGGLTLNVIAIERILH